MSTDTDLTELMTATAMPKAPVAKKPRPGKAKRQYHRRRKGAAAAAEGRAREDDMLVRSTAAIFVAAAVRVLQREHDWEREKAVAFGDRLFQTADVMARELVASTNGAAG